MRILVVGAGPAGLYFSILMKKAQPEHEITVIERNPRGVTHGWGVVFSDETLGYLEEADQETYHQITDSFQYWNTIDTHFKGTLIHSTGHGFAGIARHRLLDILVSRAEQLDVTIEFDVEVDDYRDHGDYDFVVAADGVNSKVRDLHIDTFKPDIPLGECKFIWLGTKRLLDAFTFIFEQTEHGWFQAHAYRFDKQTSTFIVETNAATWKKAGFDAMSVEESVGYLEKLFAKHLDGNPLLGTNATWRDFPTIRLGSWHAENVVLLGDAAHTAHYSIGSGTKLAMEDSIALVDAFRESSDVATAFASYEEARRPDVARIQKSAEDSRRWFENVDRHVEREPEQFVFSMLARSKAIGYENLSMRDPELVERVRTWFVETSTRETPLPERTTPPTPMFTPFHLRNMVVENRVVVSPMCMYSADDGTPNDFHLVHLGSRAMGGAGLVYTEMTNVASDGRISPGCAGMYKDEHVPAWRRIVEFVHRQSRAKICMQLGHAGRKGSTRILWEGMDEPLVEGNWPLISASAIPYTEANQTPREMNRDDMDRVKGEFAAATVRAAEAGFDMIELHLAHGYLLASFLSPLTNIRTDEYGGTLENRLRYPLEVFDAVRAAWPDAKPMSARISAIDWAPGGLTIEESVEIARQLKEHGLDIIDVSAGQTVPDQEPVYGRMFQTRFSEQIRNQVGMPTITVGNIFSADHINTILMAGRADLCALARPHLADPNWTLHAADELGDFEQTWPKQYIAIQPQPPPEN